MSQCRAHPLAALLREDGAGAAGIAMLERLIRDGMSSLHGDNMQTLREDLRRSRFLLGVCSHSG
jgi:hypothetical protein